MGHDVVHKWPHGNRHPLKVKSCHQRSFLAFPFTSVITAVFLVLKSFPECTPNACSPLVCPQGCVWAALWNGAIWRQRHFRGRKKRLAAPLSAPPSESSPLLHPGRRSSPLSSPRVLLTAVLLWLSSGTSFLQLITRWPAKVAPVNANTGAKPSRLFLDTRNAVQNVQWIKFCLRVFGADVFLCYDFIKQRFCKVFFSFVSFLIHFYKLKYSLFRLSLKSNYQTSDATGAS